MIHKLEECIKNKYDYLISQFLNLKIELNTLNNKINKSFMEFRTQYEKGIFEPKFLSESIEEIEQKANKINVKFYPFFNKEKENVYICKFINFRKYLKEDKIPDSFYSEPFSFYFHDYYIIIFPSKINGQDGKITLKRRFNVETERKYDINATFEMINRNIIKNKKFNIKITVNAKKIYYHNFYNLLNLEKDGFIQDNGNLIIICSIQNNNNYLYDIDEYYERNMKKEIKNIKEDNNINYNEKKLLGKKKEKEVNEEKDKDENSNNKIKMKKI